MSQEIHLNLVEISANLDPDWDSDHHIKCGYRFGTKRPDWHGSINVPIIMVYREAKRLVYSYIAELAVHAHC